MHNNSCAYMTFIFPFLIWLRLTLNAIDSKAVSEWLSSSTITILRRLYFARERGCKHMSRILFDIRFYSSMIKVRHVKIQSFVVDLRTIFFGSIWLTESYGTFEISCRTPYLWYQTFLWCLIGYYQWESNSVINTLRVNLNRSRFFLLMIIHYCASKNILL